MMSKKFEELYRQLNTEQRMAVDTVEGPVMVVAGPGTGKTQILTLRIANILKVTDTQPSCILALTFTESAASSMRRRLAEIIGSAAYSVVIDTFHGFCNDVIKNYPEHFPRLVGSQNITEVDQVKILENVLTRFPFEFLKPFGAPFLYLRSILSRINELKREGLTPHQFSEIVEEEWQAFYQREDLKHEKGAHKGKMKGECQKELKKLKKNKELVQIYQEYQKELSEHQFYDYSDMIMEVYQTLLQNQDFLLMLQEQHQYILVDEHQDTNNAQNRLLELLCNFHPHPNLFVVGDEKQAIFRFQGASLENFLFFQKLYPQAVLIDLVNNYRSTQILLDAAHSLIQGRKELQAHATFDQKQVALYEFISPDVEKYFLAKDIQEKINQGVSPEEIVVLYRENRDVFSVARMLEKIGIPLMIESDQDVLADPDIKKLILILRSIHEFGADAQFAEALHVDFLKIDPLDIYKIVNYARKNKKSICDLAKNESELKTLELSEPQSIHDFYQKLSKWAVSSWNKGFTDFFEEVIQESGFLAYMLSGQDPVSKMDKTNALFNQVKSLLEVHRDFQLKDFFDYLDTLQEHHLLVKRSSRNPLIKRIRLMTAHRAKGLEFEYVYVIQTVDGHWGNQKRPNLLSLPSKVYALISQEILDTNDIDDERRLFYVSMTRAKKEVALTYSRFNDEGKEQLPCQFIKEIRPELLKIMDAARYEKDFNAHKEVLFAPVQTTGVHFKEKEFVKEIFLENGFSVTALNNYLECPWKFFYMNLLRIPKAETGSELYGSAIHAALKDFFDSFKEKDPEKNYLLSRFLFYLRRQPLIQSDLDALIQKGTNALSGYFDQYDHEWKRRVLTEFTIVGVLLDPEIRIRGKIDKMEILNDVREVNVVDYKTSKPKSRNEMEGKTKNSRGNEKRQLVFYNLLLNHFEEGRFRMVSGDIDFVEPDERNHYKKEHYEIDPEEVQELENLIKKVSREILNLEFWDKRCDNEKCEFCQLREMMQ